VYTLSQNFLWGGAQYFACGSHCLNGTKLAATSAEYTNYAGFSWPVNTPGGCAMSLYADDVCATQPVVTLSVGATLGITSTQNVRAFMLVGANCYADVWGNGNASGTSSAMEPGGKAHTGAFSGRLASFVQGCDPFPFSNATHLSVNMSIGNRLYSRSTAPSTGQACTCPDGQRYGVRVSGGRCTDSWWENDNAACTFGVSSQPCEAVTDESVTCARPPVIEASFQHACGLGDVKLPVNGGHPFININGVWSPVCMH
jgi:hypothetical protein